MALTTAGFANLDQSIEDERSEFRRFENALVRCETTRQACAEAAATL